MDLDKQIRKFLAENILYVDDAFEYDNDTSFIGEGLIDSMGVMQVVAHVQSQFNIEVEQDEITPENFDSINQLVAFIRRKQAELLRSAPSGGPHADPGRVAEQQIA
jgi:acyl carrier protein